MKKVIAILIAAVLLFSLGTTAFAANFTPSVEQKDAPTVVPPKQEQIKEEGTVAVIVNSKTDSVAKEIHSSKLVVTSVAKKDESKEIPEEAKTDLDKAYKDFSDKNKKIEEVIPKEVTEAIAEEVKKEIGEDKTVNDLIVRDLFDVSLICEESNEILVDEDHHLMLTFSLGVKKDEFITAIKFNPETKAWETIRNVTNNGDGTVTCEFDHLCPIAFLSEKTETNSAQTGDNSVSLYVWIAVSVVAAGLIAVLFVAKNKKEKVSQ